MKFYDYLHQRNGRVVLAAIAAPKTEWNSPQEVFEDAYGHEQKVSGMIDDLMNLAVAEKDHAAHDFLEWFVAEQVEEEAAAQLIVEQLKLVGNAGVGLFMLDQQLGQRQVGVPKSRSRRPTDRGEKPARAVTIRGFLALGRFPYVRRYSPNQREPQPPLQGFQPMCNLVTREAPDFTAQAVMPDNSFAELKLSSYRGRYVVLFFYPLDFTFVCPSEIVAFDAALAQFEAKNVQVIGVSVDSHYTHLAWKETPRNQGGIGPDPLSAGVGPYETDRPRLRRSAGGRRGVARLVSDRQTGRCASRAGERSADRAECGRGAARGRRVAISRRARRRVSGQLARRRGGDEAQRRGRRPILGEARRLTKRATGDLSDATC